MSKAIVIGAGVAGIAAAIRLAVKGHLVEIFEAAPAPGGKLSEIRLGAYRFDAGPGLFTMPQYVDELFSLAGKDPADYFRYERLENVCRYFYEEGTRINAYADRIKFSEEIAAKTKDSAASVISFLDKSKEIYDITNPVFLERSLHKTIRLFNRYATYNGSNPYQVPATLNVIPHFEQHFGAYFPIGGMYSIVSSLVKLAMDLGVKFHFKYGCLVHLSEIAEGLSNTQMDQATGTQQFGPDILLGNQFIVPGARHP